MVVYISLGDSCVVSYQLSKYNLKTYTFPFDWIKCNNNSILRLLTDNFSSFLDPTYLVVKNTSNNFPLIDENWNDNKTNTIRVKNTKYNIDFVHDFVNGLEDLDYVIEKYNRRIERFYKIMKDTSIKKILINVSNNFDINKCYKILEENNCKNFKLFTISYEEIGKTKDWKMDEYNWEYFFNSIQTCSQL